MIKEAVILIGGMGTRLLPYTKTIPKEMLPIYDVPAIFLQVQEAYQAGIRKIIFVVSEHNKDIIQKFFTDDEYLNNFLKDKPDKLKLLSEVNEIIQNVEFVYVIQKINGTYGALYSAKDDIQNDNFIVMYGDDLFLSNYSLTEKIINEFNLTKQMYVTVLKRKINELPKVGIVKVNEENYLMDLVSQDKPHSNYLLVGRMLLNKKIFTVKEQLFEHTNHELYLSYALLLFPKQVKIYEYHDKYFNLGEKDGYIKASIAYGLAKNDEKLKKYLEEIK